MGEPVKILYKNLKGAYTGEGFLKKDGRRVQTVDAGYLAGPVHILVDEKTNRIISVGKDAPTADRVVECDHLVAAPGLVDSHTHALFGGSRWNEFFMRWGGADYAAINEAGGGIRRSFRETKATPDADLAQKLLAYTQLAYAEGVRVAEVKSGYGETLEEELRCLRLIHQAKKNTPVEIVSTFLGLHAIPSYTDEKLWTDYAIKFLEQVKAEGIAEFVDSFPERGFFSLASAREFSLAGLKLGFKVKIHADEITPIGAAQMGAEIGATSVDHLQQVSGGALELLAKVPTVATLLPATSFYLGIPYAPARKILDAGARVALATDYNPGTAPNPSLLFTTMLAASQMKMSPVEILCGVTFNAAAALGRESTYGLLRTGYHADFTLWETKSQEPLEEILLSGLRSQSPRALVK